MRFDVDLYHAAELMDRFMQKDRQGSRVNSFCVGLGFYSRQEAFELKWKFGLINRYLRDAKTDEDLIELGRVFEETTDVQLGKKGANTINNSFPGLVQWRAGRALSEVVDELIARIRAAGYAKTRSEA